MSTTAPVRLRRLRVSSRVSVPLVALLALICGASTSRGTDSQAASSASAATAASPAPTASPATAASPRTEPANPATSPTPAATPEPEQHDWQVDTEGRRYYLDTYSKTLRFLRIDAQHVRTAWGIPIIVDHEDDKNFYFRVYEQSPGTGPTPPGRQPVSDEIRRSYDVQVQTVDRLTFAPFDQGLPVAGQWRNNFVLADIDGDGHLDIVHAPPRKAAGAAPVIFLGDGHGHWKRWSAKFPPFQYDYGAAVVADLDHDGRLDLVLGAHLHGLVALVQKRPAEFELWNRGLPYRTRSEEPLAFSSRALAIVDWNHDGKPDIAALGEGPQLQTDRTTKSATGLTSARGLEVYLNQGDGSWKGVPASPTSDGLFGDQLVAADVDGDHFPDLLAACMYEARTDLLVLSGKTGGRSVDLPTRKAYDPSVAIADFDRDHRPDLAVAFQSSELGSWRNGIDLYRAQKGGKWQREIVWVETGSVQVSALAAGDVDGDGNADLVALTSDARVLVLLGNGKGGFVQQRTTDLTKQALGCIGTDVHVADLDGDGRGEIVAEFAGEPGGMPGLYEEPGCPGGGSIRAWTPALDKKGG